METLENLMWEEVKCEHIVCDEWIDFRSSTYKMPNGKISGPYYSYSRKNFVIIVATTENGEFSQASHILALFMADKCH